MRVRSLVQRTAPSSNSVRSRLGACLAMKHSAEALAKEPELAEAYMLQSLHQVMLALRAAESDPPGTGTRQLAAEAMQVSADAITQSMQYWEHAVDLSCTKQLQGHKTQVPHLTAPGMASPAFPRVSCCVGAGAAALQEARDDVCPDGPQFFAGRHSQP